MLIISDKFGRLGNNIYQLLNILLEGEERNDHVNLECLYYLNPIINIKNIEKLFNQQHNNKQQIIRHNFMPKDLHLIEMRTVNIAKFFDISKKYIHPNFNCKLDPIGADTCLIHIRSGDEFSPKHPSHPAYVQPPLNYYKKIINETQHLYKKYIIITEPDCKNPCLRLLDGYLNKVQIILNTSFVDYTYLLKFQNIILSRSSFSDSAIFLSPNIKTVYFWNYGHILGNTSLIPKHITLNSYNLTTNYIKMGEWTHSPPQLKLMISYDINNIIKNN